MSSVSLIQRVEWYSVQRLQASSYQSFMQLSSFRHSKPKKRSCSRYRNAALTEKHYYWLRFVLGDISSAQTSGFPGIRWPAIQRAQFEGPRGRLLTILSIYLN